MNSRALQFILAIFLLNIVAVAEAQTGNTGLPRNSHLLISEFVASNDTTLADEDGDFSDWIEIFNSSGSAIDIGGWYLTDDSGALTKWQFPSPTLINGDSYLVVFASKKDRAVSGSELHTNFKLSASGEYLGLIQSDGTTIDSEFAPEYPVQFTDISYGFSEDLRLRYFAEPTPGQANNSNSANLGATIVNVRHSPDSPAANVPIQITAEVSSTQNSLTQVSLVFRPMFEPEQTLQMFDDGQHGDGSENDGIFGALIPANTASPNEMIRYFITALNSESVESRQPLATGTVNAPDYFGLVIADASLHSNLETLHWFVEDIEAAETRDGTRASIFYYGTFYDNIFVRVRGGVTSKGPKFSFKFDMNNGYWFNYSSGYELMEEFNINSTVEDHTAIRPMLAFDAYKDSGEFYNLTEAVRVHRNGTFYSVATFVEHLDERYLSRHGLDPEGALYQLHNGMRSSTELVEKKTRKNEDHSDLEALVSALQMAPDEREKYLLDNVNIPTLINYLALRTTSGDWDAVCKNYYMYRDSNRSGEWYILPWDKDLAFYYWGSIHAVESDLDHPLFGSAEKPVFYSQEYICWNRLFDTVFDSALLRELYLRRLRSVMDNILQAPDTPLENRYLEQNVDRLSESIYPDIQEDKAKWSGSQPLSYALQYLKIASIAHTRQALYGTHTQENGGIIPTKQLPGSPIQIDIVEFSPVSEDLDEQFIRLYNPNNMAIDLSGWQLKSETSFQLRAGTVIPSQGYIYIARDIRAFRDRELSPKQGEGILVVESGMELALTLNTLTLFDSTGAPVTEVSYGIEESENSDSLLITEINYHPANSETRDGDDFEFIELTNISNETLALNGFKFTYGISATLPAHLIASGESIVLVKDGAGFNERYPGIEWLSEYDKSLSNGGERLMLLDAENKLISTFEYDDKSPWEETADGDGYTLTLHTAKSPPSLSCSWRASYALNGTPGSHTFDAGDKCTYFYLPIIFR